MYTLHTYCCEAKIFLPNLLRLGILDAMQGTSPYDHPHYGWHVASHKGEREHTDKLGSQNKLNRIFSISVEILVPFSATY